MDKNSEDQSGAKYTDWTVGAFFFVGCMFLGMGLGQILGERQIGMYLGMGVGMISFGVIRMVRSSKQ